MGLDDRMSVYGQSTPPFPVDIVLTVLEPREKKRLDGQNTEVENCLVGVEFSEI